MVDVGFQRRLVARIKENGSAVTASDDLESFLAADEDLEVARKEMGMFFEGRGGMGSEEERPMLCSLAHPSSLEVGTGGSGC